MIKKVLASSFFAAFLLAQIVFAFSDTSTSRYQEAIDFLEQEGIVEGYEDGTYRPTTFINRAEFTKILIEAAYPGEAKGVYCFSDVRADWYALYICFAKSEGIVQGYPDGSFRPASEINFAEALKIVLETYEIEVCKECSDIWYEPYVDKALELDILDDIAKNPAHKLTRGEMAQLIYNVMHLELDDDEEPIACEGPLFGFWSVTDDYEDMAEKTGMNAFVVSTNVNYALNTQLPEVEEAGLRAAFRMTSGNENLVTEEGDFDLDLWKELLSDWDDDSVNDYIDETLAWHMMLDDVDTFDNEFGGANPTATEMAEMAAYSKQIFPELKTFIRHDADDMPSGDYPDLDATLNQYTTMKGDIDDYIESNLEAAEELGVDAIWGLNITNGNAGTTMTADQIREYGEKLLEVPGSLGLFMWKWEDHFDSAEYIDAFEDLAELTECE